MVPTSPDAKHATFSGRATMIVFTPGGGKQTLTGATFQVEMTDNGSPGTLDRFAITIWRSGSTFRQAGTPSSQLTLGAGNVVIHKK